MALWWFDASDPRQDKPDEQPEPESLTWHQQDRARTIKRQAEQRQQHANRSGSYLVRWEARAMQRWRLTLWELSELDHGAA